MDYSEGATVAIWDKGEDRVEESLPFLVQDVFCWVDSFAEITHLYVSPEHRRKGLGSQFMKQAIENNKDYPILLEMAVSRAEYTEPVSLEGTEQIIERLEKFYVALGFKDVNDFLGCGLVSATMLYTGNEAGKILFDKLCLSAVLNLKNNNCLNFYNQNKDYCIELIKQVEKNMLEVGTASLD